MTFDDSIDRFLLLAAEMLRTQASDEAPVKTGKLRSDITVIEERRAHTVSVGQTRLIDYAKYVYFGTKPHDIKPRRKKALKTPYGIYAAVHHPGTRSNPYLDRALEKLVSSGKLHALLDDFGDEISEDIFKNISNSLKTITVK